jgi:cytoskeleton protein RodZ
MKDIGNQLREAREKKKLSIQDVAIATKINNKIIKAIEDGDTENLPAKPFLRGFVQSYARFLEVNVDDIMKKFLELQGSTTPKPQITDDGKTSQASHEEVQNKFELYKKIAYVVAALIAVVFIHFIQKTVSRYEQESKVAKEQKAAKSVSPETAAIPTDVTEVAPLLETKADVKTEEKKVEEKVEEKKIEDKKVEEKKPEEKKVEVKSPTEPLVKAPEPVVSAPVSTPIVQEKPKEIKPIVKPVEAKPVEEKKVEEKKPTKSQQLIIEALDNVEIRYTKDSDSEKTVKLKPEQFLTIRAESKININVSDSGAVNIIHNGRDKGVPGNLGQPTKISYP